MQSLSAVSLRQAWVATYELENRRPRIWRTLNGGLNWQDVSPEFQTRSYISYIHFWTPSSGIIIGDDPGDGCFEIHITENGGNTWQRVPCANFRGDTEGARRIAFNKVNVNNQGNIQFITYDLYEEGKGGKVYESNNYGRRWSVSETGMGQGSMVAYRYAGFGLAVHNKSKRDTLSCRIMRTNVDSGEWEDITPKDSSFAFFDLKYIPGTFNLVATIRYNNRLGAFNTILSEDDGTTWRVLDSITPVMSLDFVNEYAGYGGKFNSGGGRSELYAFNFKSLSDTASASAPAAARRATPLAEAFSAVVSPNPFDNELIININAKKAGQVSLNLFDITGRLVWSKKSEASVNTTFSEKIETNSLSSGTYILRILSNDQLIQQKLVKQ
ncbi:MAG: T9SS type A sorting domain-containing protein [Saprospiraceae bacterium]|nr:T9SS type A sorting domain-containing protein [Saprospiraceae bacterium]